MISGVPKLELLSNSAGMEGCREGIVAKKTCLSVSNEL